MIISIEHSNFSDHSSDSNAQAPNKRMEDAVQALLTAF